jgi:hypothetical protein
MLAIYLGRNRAFARADVKSLLTAARLIKRRRGVTFPIRYLAPAHSEIHSSIIIIPCGNNQPTPPSARIDSEGGEPLLSRSDARHIRQVRFGSSANCIVPSLRRLRETGDASFATTDRSPSSSSLFTRAPRSSPRIQRQVGISRTSGSPLRGLFRIIAEQSPRHDVQATGTPTCVSQPSSLTRRFPAWARSRQMQFIDSRSAHSIAARQRSRKRATPRPGFHLALVADNRGSAEMDSARRWKMIYGRPRRAEGASATRSRPSTLLPLPFIRSRLTLRCGDRREREFPRSLSPEHRREICQRK